MNDSGRGFWASYASAGASAKLNLAPHFVELAAGARRWFFTRAGATNAALVLPPEAWVGEIRLRYTLWMLEPDRSLWEPQRLFPRLTGVAFGVELGLDARSQAQPWGARDPAAFAPADLRNDPSRAIFTARQWLRAGAKLHARLRLQIDETASWMWGADDLVRARIGGLNPYSVPLVGAPWAGYLADDFAAADVSLHVRVVREHEVGVLVDGVALDDVHRTGGPTARTGVLAGDRRVRRSAREGLAARRARRLVTDGAAEQLRRRLLAVRVRRRRLEVAALSDGPRRYCVGSVKARTMVQSSPDGCAMRVQLVPSVVKRNE